jgi:hypothetical protein
MHLRLHPIYLVLILSSWFATPAYGQSGGFGGQLNTQFVRGDESSGRPDLVTLGAQAEIDVGKPIGGIYLFGEAHVGAALAGGVAYRLAALPFGAAIHDRGRRFFLGLTYGFQIQGVTSHEDFVVQAPLRLALRVRPHSRVLLSAWASSEFTLGEERDEKDAFGPGAELRTGLNLRLGKEHCNPKGCSCDGFACGLYVGLLYAERLGTKFWGLTLGYGVDYPINDNRTRRRSQEQSRQQNGAFPDRQ